MTKRKFIQNKLWRDKAIEMVESKGSIVHWKHLSSDAEYDLQLRAKLVEESQEVVEAKDKKELSLELSDLCELIDALCELHGIDVESIHKLKKEKRNHRGGFEGRKYVTIAEHLPGSDPERYCLAQPHKYPEVIS